LFTFEAYFKNYTDRISQIDELLIKRLSTLALGCESIVLLKNFLKESLQLSGKKHKKSDD
jgi:hypothetical protein